MDKAQHPSGGKMRSSRSGRRMTPDRHWTLMFIGDHGKVITLKHFKGLVIAGLLIVCLAVAAVVGFYLFNRTLVQQNRRLEASVQSLQEQLGALRHDNEILMARLVLVQTRKQEKQVPQPAGWSDEKKVKQTEQKQTVVAKQPVPAAAAKQPESMAPPPGGKSPAAVTRRMPSQMTGTGDSPAPRMNFMRSGVLGLESTIR